MVSVKNEVVLIIIYNHRYDKNIDVLENIYKKRFSNIFHLMPFYDGEKSNVIPVYENSHCFQGYIAQGFDVYFKERYAHYIYVADDLILNPEIDEHNYVEYFCVDECTSFIPELVTLHEREEFWNRLADACKYTYKKIGVEVENELPEYEEALEHFGRFNLTIKPLKFNQIYPKIELSTQLCKSWRGIKSYLKYMYNKLNSSLGNKSYDIAYPLVGGYSDIAIVPAGSIKSFCHYCGIFSATDLFVELAIPTALVLTSEKIITEKDLLLQGKALWTSEDYKELWKYNKKLSNLFSGFPDGYLYLHPIKLSGWDTDT